MELATAAGDAYLQVTALSYAGLASVEHGYPDDGLKMLQCAQAKAWDIPPDDQRAVVVGASGSAAAEACVLADSANALARLGNFAAAASHLAKGRELWTPTRTDPFGDMDRPAARLELARGRLDAAEALAAASVRRWPGGKQISRALSGAVLATIHVRTGERGGLQLAHHTITAVAQLSSVRVRRQLVPLAQALAARPGSDGSDGATGRSRPGSCRKRRLSIGTAGQALRRAGMMASRPNGRQLRTGANTCGAWRSASSAAR